MLCDKCKKNEANLFYSSNVNGVKTEIHLCSECARKELEAMAANKTNNGNLPQSYFKGLQDMQSYMQGMDDFMHSIFKTHSMFEDPFERSTANNLSCPRCQMTADEFRATGLLGCPDCYETFHDLLVPVFQKVQGNAKHVAENANSDAIRAKILAKKTEKSKEKAENAHLKELKKLQNEAVKEENYELAAKYRDEIKDFLKAAKTPDKSDNDIK